MQTIVLDGRRMRTKEAAHAYIARKLSFPEYYGGNLDALYDCLTDVGCETELVVKYVRSLRRRLGEYGDRLLETLWDAARQNDKINILFFDSYR